MRREAVREEKGGEEGCERVVLCYPMQCCDIVDRRTRFRCSV